MRNLDHFWQIRHCIVLLTRISNIRVVDTSKITIFSKFRALSHIIEVFNSTRRVIGLAQIVEFVLINSARKVLACQIYTVLVLLCQLMLLLVQLRETCFIYLLQLLVIRVTAVAITRGLFSFYCDLRLMGTCSSFFFLGVAPANLFCHGDSRWAHHYSINLICTSTIGCLFLPAKVYI